MHDTKRTPEVAEHPYEVTEKGWGEFEALIDLYFQVCRLTDLMDAPTTLPNEPTDLSPHTSPIPGRAREAGGAAALRQALPREQPQPAAHGAGAGQQEGTA